MFPENTGHENETFTCDATRQTLKRLPLSTCDLQLLVGKGPFWVNILLIAGWLHVVSFAYYSQTITLWFIERSLLVAHHHGDLEFVPLLQIPRVATLAPHRDGQINRGGLQIKGPGEVDHRGLVVIKVPWGAPMKTTMRILANDSVKMIALTERAVLLVVALSPIVLIVAQNYSKSEGRYVLGAA
jgi:hypothetical protein